MAFPGSYELSFFPETGEADKVKTSAFLIASSGQIEETYNPEGRFLPYTSQDISWFSCEQKL
jgi:hypothetical protein